jgi:hypothetical protein
MDDPKDLEIEKLKKSLTKTRQEADDLWKIAFTVAQFFTIADTKLRERYSEVLKTSHPLNYTIHKDCLQNLKDLLNTNHDLFSSIITTIETELVRIRGGN